jgi:7-carboxy-7-deazaguanine synthase
MREKKLHIHEIFFSIQGESSKVGLPCVFVRLRGCPLRCRYCDTSYAFSDGEGITLAEIIVKVQSYACKLVEITGGEPLIQSNVHPLMESLCDLGYEVMIETSGQQQIDACDPRVKRIVDIKTPNSGAADSFLASNYGELRLSDEVKFVITDKEDFDWSLSIVNQHALLDTVCAVHFSPVMFQEPNNCIKGCDALSPETLASWILESGSNVRLHLQLHRYVWDPNARGV